MALNNRQRAFVKAYVGKARYNATEAAKAAGYAPASARNQGHRMMINDDIRAAIDARLRPHLASPNEILTEIKSIAYDAEEETRDRLKALDMLTKAAGLLVQKVEVTGKDGGPIETHHTGITAEAILNDDHLRDLARASLRQSRDVESGPSGD